MVKEKNTTGIIIAFIVFIIGILLLSYQPGFKAKTFSIVPIEEGKSSSSYSCPLGKDVYCIVRGTLECKDPDIKDEFRVVSRVDDNNFDNGWIAYDEHNGFGLTSWVFDTFVLRRFSAVIFDLPLGQQAFFYTENDKRGMYVLTGLADKYWRYRQEGGADLTPTPKEPYSSTGREKYEDPKVIFRTNARFSEYNKPGAWIAIDTGRNVLDGYSYDGSGVLLINENQEICRPVYCINNERCISCPSRLIPTIDTDLWRLVLTLSDGRKIYLYYSQIYIFRENNIFDRYTLSSLADLTPTPKEPYSSTGREILRRGVSDKDYSCSGEFRVEKSRMDRTLLYQERLNCDSINPCQDSSVQKRIEPGNIASILEGDVNTIGYKVFKDIETCIVDVCNPEGTGIIRCINKRPSSNIEQCDVANGFICSEDQTSASCVQSVGLTSSKLTTDSGLEVQGFNINESINYKFTLFSRAYTSGKVFVILRDSQNQKIAERELSEVKFDGSLNSIRFNSIKETGLYNILVTIPELNIQYSSAEFRISQEITMSISARSGLGSILYSNEEFIIDIKTAGSLGRTTVDSILLDVRQGNNVYTVPSAVVPVEDKINDVYIYSFHFIPIPLESVETQDLSVEAKVFKGGIEKIQKRVFTLNRASVQIDFTDDELFKIVSPGVYTLKFETRTPQKELIDTTNKLSVITDEPKRDISNLIVREGVGLYSFAFNFDKVNTYFFELKSDFQGLGSSILASLPMDVQLEGGSPSECIENKDCSSGKICSDNICVSPPDVGIFSWTTVFLIIGVIILIIIIIRTVKKREAQVSPRLTGL